MHCSRREDPQHGRRVPFRSGHGRGSTVGQDIEPSGAGSNERYAVASSTASSGSSAT